MKGTRWRSLLRSFLGRAHRELGITLTRVPHPRAWAFVVGCYNSGTTLLAQMLGHHPRISVLPQEGQFLTDQWPADYELGLPRMWVLREELFRLTEADAGPDVVRLKKEWGWRLDTAKEVLVEKSPQNAARTRWLQHHFENAHFVAIVRNGYAVAEGIRRKAEPTHLSSGWPIDKCAYQWARSNQILLEDATYLKHVIWVRYEQLSSDPNAEIARVLRFLGLDPSELRLDADRAWQVHERAGPIANLNESNLGRLSPGDIRIISDVAGHMLRHFGYAVL